MNRRTGLVILSVVLFLVALVLVLAEAEVERTVIEALTLGGLASLAASFLP